MANPKTSCLLPNSFLKKFKKNLNFREFLILNVKYPNLGYFLEIF